MKIVLIVFLIVALLIGGVLGYYYFGQSREQKPDCCSSGFASQTGSTTPFPHSSPSLKTQTPPTVQAEPNVTLTGILSKAVDPNGEYTHLLKSTSAVTGVNSYSVPLDNYD